MIGLAYCGGFEHEKRDIMFFFAGIVCTKEFTFVEATRK